jgi:hypothetical protein
MPPTSPFERRVREPCQQLIDSTAESEVVELSRELRELIHERALNRYGTVSQVFPKQRIEFF